MTVTELITELQKFPGDALVVASKDAEGNGFSPLDEIELAWYLADSTWSGERETEDEDSVSSDSIPAVFLWPTN